MIMQIFSVLDKAASAFLPPFYSRTKGEALRSFGDALTDEKHAFTTHPDDYVLYRLGEFDDNSGIMACGEPERIVSAREMLPSV